MKVYVLIEQDKYGYDDIVEVYSTIEKARDDKRLIGQNLIEDKLERQGKYGRSKYYTSNGENRTDYYINEYEVL